MAAEVKKEIQLEIAHVLFTDIVAYSKLPINQQRAVVECLNEIVRGTDEYQAAESAGRLITIPTGDGITLVFYHFGLSPEVVRGTQAMGFVEPTPIQFRAFPIALAAMGVARRHVSMFPCAGRKTRKLIALLFLGSTRRESVSGKLPMTAGSPRPIRPVAD